MVTFLPQATLSVINDRGGKSVLSSVLHLLVESIEVLIIAMTESDPATARKRRKEIMQSLRAGENENATEKEPQQDDALPPKKRKVAASKKKKKKAAQSENDGEAKNKNDTESDGNQAKTQIRYDPDVPMSKEQLAAWRREARRVRNRESAAASRQRIRDRINELEGEVGEWKAKYDQAMARLEQVEQLPSQQSR